MQLERVGYWADPGTQWPQVDDLTDPGWCADERDAVIEYLRRGFVVRVWLGFAKCRVCGAIVGDTDLSDGVFVWPGGLEHYLAEHAVRLPDWFVAHALARLDEYDDAEFVDGRWGRCGSD